MTAVRTASTRDKAKEISAKGMVTVNPASRIGHRAFSIMDNVCCKIYSPFLFILKIKKLCPTIGFLDLIYLGVLPYYVL